MSNPMCRIPVKARMEIINGKAVMTSAEWADIPADDIAQYIIEKLGPGFWEKKAAVEEESRPNSEV